MTQQIEPYIVLAKKTKESLNSDIFNQDTISYMDKKIKNDLYTTLISIGNAILGIISKQDIKNKWDYYPIGYNDKTIFYARCTTSIKNKGEYRLGDINDDIYPLNICISLNKLINGEKL